MILPIQKYPDPILRKKCEEVKEVSEEIKKLAEDMMETATANQGVGLAASQVGELKRIIVVCPIQECSPKEVVVKRPQVFINPQIIKKSSEVLINEEGCLSFPGLFLKIRRAKEVEVEALNEKGEKIYFKAESLLAGIFQHEIDHLNGILFIDKIGCWQKLKIRQKLKSYGTN